MRDKRLGAENRPGCPAPDFIPAENERQTLIGNSHSGWYSERGHVKGAGASQTGQKGRAALRLCNLVAPGTGNA